MNSAALHLGRPAEADSARPLLRRAQLAEARGDVIAAGVLLRESLRRQLCAIGTRHDALPARQYVHRSPLKLARWLRQSELLMRDDFDRIRQMIHVGNVAAHCGPVDRELLAVAIRALQRFIERESCGDRRCEE